MSEKRAPLSTVVHRPFTRRDVMKSPSMPGRVPLRRGPT